MKELSMAERARRTSRLKRGMGKIASARMNEDESSDKETMVILLLATVPAIPYRLCPICMERKDASVLTGEVFPHEC